MIVDTSQIDALGDILSRTRVGTVVRPVMSKAGLQMKRAAAAAAPSGAHIRGYSRTIEYEIKDGGLAVEVAPREEGQGLLSAVLEYGQGPNGAHPHIIPALEPEADVTAAFLADAIVEAILR